MNPNPQPLYLLALPPLMAPAGLTAYRLVGMVTASSSERRVLSVALAASAALGAVTLSSSAVERFSVGALVG